MIEVSRKADETYKIVCCILLISLNLMFELNNMQWSIFFKAISIISFTIICFLFVYFSFKYKFKTQDLVVLTVLLVTEVICFIFHDNEALLLLIAAVLFSFLKEIDIINIYLWTLIIVFFITATLSFLGVLPLTADRFYVLGFGYKNRIGFILFSICLYTFFIIKNRYSNKLTTVIGYLLLFLAIFLEQALQDRTAMVLLLLFLVIYSTHVFKFNNKFFAILIISLPLILIAISLFLSFNLTRFEWINKLNELLSLRISLWNNDWSMYNLTIFPQQLNSYFSYITNYGQNVSVTALDGYFALGMLQHGIIFFMISIYSLMHMLFINLEDINDEKELLMCITVIFILYSFSESIPAVSYLCFLFPTAFSLKSSR